MSKRTHPKATTNTLATLLRLADKKQIAAELGVTPSALSGWLKKEEMPVIAARACEGLLRRFKRQTNGEQTLVVKCPQAQRETVTTVLEGLGCKTFVVPFND